MKKLLTILGLSTLTIVSTSAAITTVSCGGDGYELNQGFAKYEAMSDDDAASQYLAMSVKSGGLMIEIRSEDDKDSAKYKDLVKQHEKLSFEDYHLKYGLAKSKREIVNSNDGPIVKAIDEKSAGYLIDEVKYSIESALEHGTTLILKYELGEDDRQYLQTILDDIKLNQEV